MRYTEAHRVIHSLIDLASHARQQLRAIDEQIQNAKIEITRAQQRMTEVSEAITLKADDPAWRELAAIKAEVDADLIELSQRADGLLGVVREEDTSRG